MVERLRPIFLSILCLFILWFVVILFWLARGDEPQLQPRFSYHNEPDHLVTGNNVDTGNGPHDNDYKSTNVAITKREILFHQFVANFPIEIQQQTNSTSGKLHIERTQRLNHNDGPLDKLVIDEGSKLFAFNLLVSNRIGVTRPLPDTRNERCNIQSTTSTLIPSEPESFAKQIRHCRASVVICYYNEAPSALIRTIYTIIERSPGHLLQEIIVIDDCSDDEYSAFQLGPLINSSLVAFKRTTKREGLIRARLFGANIAKGEILVFLDSHVEANIGWLEPLLAAINDNRTTVACPMIDLINAETLIYSASPMVKGGLDWALHFKWDSVPSEKLMTVEDFVKPIESPTMAGGLYAVDREFFFHLGAYDSEMELWGGENIELSLRTWMCGGRIVILPCSRLGHIFRKRRPYGPEANKPDSLLYNSHRAARVWLDEYISKFYEANPGSRYLESGDISQRLALKQMLKCQNFSWFLSNIYQDLNQTKLSTEKLSKPSLFKFNHSMGTDRKVSLRPDHFAKPVLSNIHRPERQIPLQPPQAGNANLSLNSRVTITHPLHRNKPRVISRFQIQTANSNLCIESRASVFAKSFRRLVLNNCNDGKPHENSSPHKNQLWTETEIHDLRLGENQCLDMEKNLPLLRQCHDLGSFQSWFHRESNSSNTTICDISGSLCLGVERLQVEEPIIVTICDKATDQGRLGSVATPGWRTGSAFARMKFRGMGIESVRPSQRWNLLIYKY